MLAAVCCCAVLFLLVLFALRSLEEKDARSSFERAANERFDELQGDLDLSVSKVQAVSAFCALAYPPTREAFESFAAPLIAGHDAGIKALEWVPRVPLAQRKAVEAGARATGYRDFVIRERAADGSMIPAGERSEYYPVLWMQPRTGNERALGFDLGSNAERREALNRAAETGAPTATQRIILVAQDSAGQYATVIFHPVYRSRGSKGRELLGFALGALRLADVVERHGANSGVDLAIDDLDVTPREQRLYRSASQTAHTASDFAQYRTILVAGRHWRLAASPVPGKFPIIHTYSTLGFGLALIFAFLTAMYLGDSLRRRIKVEEEVEERTQELHAALTSLAVANRGLEESEGRYRLLVDESPAAIVVEREGKIVLVNRAALDLFGFNGVPESEPRSLLEFVAPERSADAEGVIQALYARDCQVPLRETRLLRRDGSVMDSEIAASSYLHEGSRSVQVLVRDISQRKHDEAEKARLFRAIEQAAESIVITDKNAKIVFVNPAFERVSGYTREEAIGLNPRVLKSGHQPPEFYTSMWQKLAAGESWTGRFINCAKDGRLYTEEATISPVVNREGELINYVAVKRDVTAENALHEQLHQSQKMDAVGRLAGGVAHDFNNMLMVINSYAELLAADLGEQDPRYVYTTKILRAAERSAALTRQLLTFSRKQVFSPVVLDCNAILAETCSMVRRLIAENIELKCDLIPDLWSTKADPDQFVQVILNLCLNARDAMPHGGTLTLSTRNHPMGDGYVEIAIADTGIGIPLDLQEKLFEPFFTTKGVEKGTGLGLSIVYGSVQQSGGYIIVESLPGFGATFRVFLPRSTEQLVAERKQVHKTVPSEPALVLLVEDEEALRVAIAEHLRSNGCRVIGASNGVEALKLLSENPGVAILITDLIMPRMGGRELVRLATERKPDLRVMVLSGYANESFSPADCNGCPSAFLMKPFSLGAMMARLSELRNSQRSTIAPPAHEN